MDRDDFNIDDFRLEAAPPIAEQPGSERRPRRQDLFVMVPLEWMHRLAGAHTAATCTVALHLLFRAFQERQQTIKLANRLLASLGVSRWQKWRALAELEAMGLISVEHRERKSPIITLLYPAQEK
jgi:hypothetical protein